jgi:hypothetical protein
MGWAVGIRPRQLLSLGNNVLDLVQPCVLVHAVDVDTGQYECVGVPGRLKLSGLSGCMQACISTVFVGQYHVH